MGTYPNPWYRIDQLDRLGASMNQHRRVRPTHQLISFFAMKATYVVDDDVDSLDINTSTENVGSDKYTFLESLELLEPGDTFRLG
jgi:hypothetical protein